MSMAFLTELAADVYVLLLLGIAVGFCLIVLATVMGIGNEGDR